VTRQDVFDAIAEIWGEILRVEVDGETDFFDVGGYSLAIQQMAARVNEKFGSAVSLRETFENPTLDEFVDMVISRMAPVRTS
jgi:hypothetical protein